MQVEPTFFPLGVPKILRHATRTIKKRPPCAVVMGHPVGRGFERGSYIFLCLGCPITTVLQVRFLKIWNFRTTKNRTCCVNKMGTQMTASRSPRVESTRTFCAGPAGRPREARATFTYERSEVVMPPVRPVDGGGGGFKG